jgi:hypothetical protein
LVIQGTSVFIVNQGEIKMKISAIEKFLVTSIFMIVFSFLLLWVLANHANAETTYKPPQHGKQLKHKKRAMRVVVPNPPSGPILIPPSQPLFFRKPRIEHTSWPFVIVQGPVNFGLTPLRAVFEPDIQPYPTYIWHQPFTLPHN